MPANLIVTLAKLDYDALVNNTSEAVVAAKADPLFVFDAAGHKVEIHGEFRDLGTSSKRRAFRDLVSPDLRDPEKAIARFGTPQYKLDTKNRRDQARLALAVVAPPGAPVIGPPAGVTGQMDASQAGKQMLTTGGGLVLGYDHKDQGSKDFTADLIKKSGGTDLKHLFVEELSSDLQADIDAFLDDRAAEMPTSLLTRIKELQDSSLKADFEPMLYAAREKGVRIWGIDTPKADPQVSTEDPRYHERRLALMNAEAKRVFDQVRLAHPTEPFMALTGQMHVNTAEGGVPGLAQIMGVPGVCFDAGSKRLAFIPEDTSKRAAVSPLERECTEAILKQAGIDYKIFSDNYVASPAYTSLPDPKIADRKLDLREVTVAVQQVVAQFTVAGTLTLATAIPGLVTNPAVAAALQPIFNATIRRSDRRKNLQVAIKAGDHATVKSSLKEDPYLCKLPADDGKKDTLLHAACQAGHPAVVRELIKRGLNPNAIDLTGKAPIHYALGERTGAAPPASALAAIVGRLLTAGASETLADPSGKTGLELAKTGPQADPQLVRRLLRAGKVPATDLFTIKFVEAAKARYAAVKVPVGADFDVDEARQAATALVGTLGGAGVPLGTRSEVAAAMTNGAVTAELGRLTTLFGARAQQKAALVKAIDEKNVVNMRAAFAADPRLAYIPIEGKKMALGLAAIWGDDGVMDELINNQHVPVDQKSPIGRTALHEILAEQTSKTDRVAQQSVTDRAQKLIARGADVNARNARGQTALHVAGFRNNVPMITALNAQTVPPAVPDPTALDDRGWTPLDMTLAATNREAEVLFHAGGVGVPPPLKGGRLSTVDILSQATMCEDPADSHKARKFIERLYANAELRPMLHLAAAAACNPHKPGQGGLRLFASKGGTVGSLYGQAIGATAAYDEKVNTLLFPLEDGKEGEAVGSLAHELTHLTAHLVTNNPATLPFTATEKAAYLAAIDEDVRKIQLLDPSDPFQKLIKNRFSDRMDSYKSKPNGGALKTGAEFDESLLQEFIVGVPQIAAVYGMDELEKHLPGLVGYYKNVWTPMVQSTLALDPRFAAGRAKIDVAANGRATRALAGHPRRQLKKVERITLPKDDDRLDIDTLMAKVEADFVATKGHPKARAAGGRTINYEPNDFELRPADVVDFAKKKPLIRAALETALLSENFPAEINLNEIRNLVENVTGAAALHSGSNLKTALSIRTANWVKDAKTAFVERRVEGKYPVTPQDLAETIVYRAEAIAQSGGADTDADLDPDTEVKASKQKDLIKALVKSLSEAGNAEKLKDPATLIAEMSKTLSDPLEKAVYLKAGATTHVSVNVSKAKSAWLLKLGNL